MPEKSGAQKLLTPVRCLISIGGGGTLSESDVIDSQWVWRHVILPSGRYLVKSADSFAYYKGGVVKGVEGSRR